MTAEEDVGTNGGSSWSLPSSPDASDATHLLTTYGYDAAGNQNLVKDPRGIQSLTVFDMLSRQTQTIAAYTDGVATSDTNQTTESTYDGNDHVLTMTAIMPTGQPDQTTAYIYGVGESGGLFSNDLINKTEYPDSTTGAASTSAANDVSYTYDNLGETLDETDQNGTNHTYSYNPLGQMTLDSITTLGTGVDGSVMALGYTYNDLGLPYQQTSYSNAAGTTAVNQDQNVYNGLQQLTGEYQAVGGAVNTSSSPEVQYVYNSPTYGSNLAEMIYPNGRILLYGYDNNALDTAIGRVDYLADDNGSGSPTTPHLVDYTYLGFSTIVGQADGNGVAQSTALDPFGRVAETKYVNTATSTSTDDFQYGYDADGNVLYKNNLVNSAFSELYHANSSASGDDSSAYDPLNRLTGFSRGTLSASGAS
ncbi:MAG TPA: hypothetical protein VG326_14275 [Tepidisphaeraceae bacterium]|jgi:YD repeat-containing protein|nr:hypothetical protein [Tepidisphaeraceae bacterium]